MGWVALLFLIALSLALLWALRVRGPLLQLSAAALLFGAAGYAAQCRPGLGSAPKGEAETAAPIPLTTLRHAFFGSFSGSEHWMLISESYARRGQTADAVGVLRSAVREHPGGFALWVALGNALVDHARGITPAAQLAYRRAAELAPGHPAPKFFYGLALARSGDREGALMLWNSALAEAPADASWRPYVEDAVRALNPPRNASSSPRP
jgi:cytochrome c-type biogenesis protein CcmH